MLPTNEDEMVLLLKRLDAYITMWPDTFRIAAARRYREGAPVDASDPDDRIMAAVLDVLETADQASQ